MAMLFPTYRDLIKSINSTSEDGKPIIESRYSVVIAASKRARQIVEHGDRYMDDEKALTTAINELNNGAVRVLRNEDAEQ